MPWYDSIFNFFRPNQTELSAKINSESEARSKRLSDLEFRKSQLSPELALKKIEAIAPNLDNAILLQYFKFILQHRDLKTIPSNLQSFLHLICNSDFEELIHYVVSLPKAEHSLSSSNDSLHRSTSSDSRIYLTSSSERLTGDYLDNASSDETMSYVTELFNRLCAVEDKNEIWEDANSLFQTSMDIYKRLELLQIESNSSENNISP